MIIIFGSRISPVSIPNHVNEHQKFHNNLIIIIQLRIIIGSAAEYDGICGKIILNDAGDRINGNNDIWTVVKSQKDFDNYIWKQDISSIYTQPLK